MKPYIGKNDGVPDNNRYSEALEAAKETVEALNKLTDQALLFRSRRWRSTQHWSTPLWLATSQMRGN